MESLVQPRDRWQDLEQHWRKRLSTANGEGGRALELESLDDLRTALNGFRTDDTSHESDSQPLVSDVLSHALNNLSPFAKAVEQASQSRKASALLWAGVLSVIQVHNSHHSLFVRD